MNETPTPKADEIFAGVASLSNEELIEDVDLLFKRLAAAEGLLVKLLGEASRRGAFLPPAPPT
jgi:hypothetical protein